MLPGTKLVTPNRVLKAVAAKALSTETDDLPDDYRITVVEDEKLLLDHVEKKLKEGRYKSLSLELVKLMGRLQSGSLEKGEGERLREVLREVIAMKKDPPEWLATLGKSLAPAKGETVDEEVVNAAAKVKTEADEKKLDGRSDVRRE